MARCKLRWAFSKGGRRARRDRLARVFADKLGEPITPFPLRQGARAEEQFHWLPFFFFPLPSSHSVSPSLNLPEFRSPAPPSKAPSKLPVVFPGRASHLWARSNLSFIKIHPIASPALIPVPLNRPTSTHWHTFRYPLTSALAAPFASRTYTLGASECKRTACWTAGSLSCWCLNTTYFVLVWVCASLALSLSLSLWVLPSNCCCWFFPYSQSSRTPHLSFRLSFRLLSLPSAARLF